MMASRGEVAGAAPVSEPANPFASSPGGVPAIANPFAASAIANPFAAPAAPTPAPSHSHGGGGHGHDDDEDPDQFRYGIAASGPPVNPVDVESGVSAVEVTLMWGDMSVLHVAHLSPHISVTSTADTPDSTSTGFTGGPLAAMP